MIVRIVKMHFKTQHITAFKELFDNKKEQIRAQPGCTFLELYQDVTHPELFFTYSYWDSEDHLNDYRNSPLFSGVWPQTKKLFSQPAQAFTVNKIHSLV